MSYTALHVEAHRNVGALNPESLQRFRSVKKDMETRLDPNMVTNDFVLSTLLDVYDLHREHEVSGE